MLKSPFSITKNHITFLTGDEKDTIVTNAVQIAEANAKYFTYFLINWLKQWDEEISFKEMPKSEVLQVTWGDYKNYSFLIL